MNQPVRYVAMVFALLISTGKAFALDTLLSPLYIGGKIGVSLMSANDIANTSSVASLTKTDSHDTVVPVGAAIGYNWRKHGVSLRTEFEISPSVKLWLHLDSSFYQSNKKALFFGLMMEAKAEPIGWRLRIRAY